MAQLTKGGSNPHNPGSSHGGHGGGAHSGPLISVPIISSSSAIPFDIVVTLLNGASQAWGIPFSELFAAFGTGELTIVEVSPGVYRISYDGTTIDLILEDL